MDQAQTIKRFYDLVWPQLPAMLRLARILTGDATEAEDLAQETMLKAFKAIERFQAGTDVRAWLAAILRNVRIDRLRAMGASARDVSLEEFAQEPAAVSAVEEYPGSWEGADQALERFSDQQIIEALKRLPEEIRWTLLLIDVQGIRQEEAAAILEVPVGTVKSRAHRGRAMLRQALLPLARDRGFVRE